MADFMAKAELSYERRQSELLFGTADQMEFPTIQEHIDDAVHADKQSLVLAGLPAIYEKKNGGQLSLFEDEEDEFLDLNEAEEILRQLRKENPGEYQRIADLRDGIRAAKTSTHKSQFVFCEASYPERETAKGFQQLFLLDAGGAVVSKDIPKIVCSAELV